MGFFGFGNKPLGTYPNGVPYDKRRYNPHHPNCVPPPFSSPAHGYPADAWMTRAPYTTTSDFRWSQWQNSGASIGGIGMRSPGGMGSNAGAVGGLSPMGVTGSVGASRRASLAGVGGIQGAPARPDVVAGVATQGLGAFPNLAAAAGSRQRGTGGFGGMRGGRPFGIRRGAFNPGTGRRRSD